LFGHAGRRAVSGSLDGTLRVWNLETGGSTVLEGHTEGVTSVSVTADGRRAVSGSEDKTLRMWNLETGASTVLQGQTDVVWSVSVTADGRRAVSGGRDRTLRVWNLETGACLAIARLSAPCDAVAATDGRLIVACTRTGEVLFLDLHGIDLSAAGGGAIA
jgi:WD40 repeat protein